MLAALLTNLPRPGGNVSYRANPWKDYEPKPKKKKKKKKKDDLIFLMPH